MAKQYRLTRVDSSNGPDFARELDRKPATLQDEYHDEQRMVAVRQQRSGRGWRFAFIGLVIVLLGIGVAVWMNGVSGSITRLSQTATQNSHSIAHESAQLTSLQTHMDMLRMQISQLSQQIAHGFQTVMQAIHDAKL